MSAGVNGAGSGNPAEQYQEWIQQQLAQAQALAAQIAQLQQQMGTAQGNLNNLIAEQADLENQIAQIQAELAKMGPGKDQDSGDQGSGDAPTRDQLEKQLAALQGKLSTVNENIASAKATISNLSTQIASDKGSLNSLNNNSSAQSIQQLMHEARMDNNNTQRKGLGSSNPQGGSAVDKLQQMFEAARDKLQAQIAQTNSDIAADQAAIAQDEAEENDLKNGLINDLFSWNSGKFESDIGKIQQLDQQIAALQADLSSKQSQLANMQQSLNQQNAGLNDSGKPITAADLQQAANALAQAEAQMAQETQALINDIVKMHGQIANDKIEIQKLEDERTKLYVALAACGIFCWVAMAVIGAEIDDVNDEIDGVRHNIDTCQAQINDDMEKLQGLIVAMAKDDRSGMINDLKQISALVAQLLKLLTGGPITEAGMKQAAGLLVEILSLLQMILVKVANQKGSDETWMSQATQGMYQMSTQDAVANVQKIAEAQSQASFMKAVMQVVQIVMIVAMVALAAATGGAGAAAVAAVMGILMAAGVFDMLSNAIADGLEKAGCPGAKVFAEVITTVIAIVCTLGLMGLEALGQAAVKMVAEFIAENIAEDIASKGVSMATGSVTSAVEQAAEGATAAVANDISLDVAGRVASKTIAESTQAGVEAAAKNAASSAAKAAANGMAKAAYKEGAEIAIKQALSKQGVGAVIKAGVARALARAAAATGFKMVVCEELTQVGARAGEVAAKNALDDAIVNGSKALEEAALAGAKSCVGGASDAEIQSAAKGVGEAAGKATARAAAPADGFSIAGRVAETYKNTNLKAVGVSTWLSTNGLVDLITQFMLIKKTQAELDADDVWQDVKIALQVVQAVVEIFTMGRMASASSAAKAVEAGGDAADTFMGMSRQSIIKGLQLVQLGADGVSIYANLETMEAMLNMSDAHKAMAEDQRNITLYQSIMSEFGKLNKATGDVRAAIFEQQMKSMTQTIQSMGSAEREAARLMVEKAV